MSWKAAGVVAAILIAAVAIARVAQDPDTGTTTWDASRASGFASYLLLWSSVLVGTLLNLRVRPAGVGGALPLELHRICSTLAASFLAVHVAALLMDPVVHFAPIDALVPFTSGYSPIGVGVGTIAQWLVAAVLASTALSAGMPYVAWRWVHLLSYPAFVLALLHGIIAGTDSEQSVALAIYAITGATVAAAAVYRIAGRGWTAAPEGAPNR